MCHPGHDREDHDNASLPCPPIQTHTHEFAGSVQIAGPIPHNHRLPGCIERYHMGNHVHAILVNTDTLAIIMNWVRPVSYSNKGIAYSLCRR